MESSPESHTHSRVNTSPGALYIPQMCSFAVSTSQPSCFVSHSNLLPRSFSVRYATAADIPFVEKLTNGLEGNEGILCDLKKYLHASRDPIAEGACPLCAVVGVCAEQVVGVAVVRTEEVQKRSLAHITSHKHMYLKHRTLTISELITTLKTLFTSTIIIHQNMVIFITLYLTLCFPCTQSTS